MKEQKLQIIIITVAIVLVVGVTALAMVMINNTISDKPTTDTTKKEEKVVAGDIGVNINYAINAIVNEKLEPKYESGEITSYSVVSAEQLTSGKECSKYQDSAYQVEVELRYTKESNDKVLFPGNETVSPTNALETVAKVNFALKDKGNGENGYTIVADFVACEE